MSLNQVQEHFNKEMNDYKNNCFIKEVIGKEGIFIKENEVGKHYCPSCCSAEYKTRIITVPILFGVFSRRKEETYVHRPEQPICYEKGGFGYCGKCKQRLYFKLKLEGDSP